MPTVIPQLKRLWSEVEIKNRTKQTGKFTQSKTTRYYNDPIYNTAYKINPMEQYPSIEANMVLIQLQK